MFVVKQHFLTFLFIKKRILKQSQFKLCLQNFTNSIIHLFPRQLPPLYRINNMLHKIRTMHMHVYACIDSYDGCFLRSPDSTMLTVHTLYVHPVANYKTIKVPSVSKQLGQQKLVSMTWNPVQFIMGSHQRGSTCFHAGLEWRKKDFIQHTVRGIKRRTVSSIDRLTTSHQMLNTSQHTLRFIGLISL